MASRLEKLLVLGSLALTPTWAACGSHSGAPANSVLVANQRLAGSWRLQSFAAEVSLDLPLQAVLSAEVGQLMVTFNQGQYSASGPGVTLNGRYEVTNAGGDQLELTMYDQTNVAYHFLSQFAGNLLHFQSTDKPWRGVGALQRQ